MSQNTEALAIDARRLVQKLMMLVDVVASAIEARSDATGTGAAEGESAVGEAETPKGGAS